MWLNFARHCRFFFQFDVLFYVIDVMKATLWWIFAQCLVELMAAIIPDFSNVPTRAYLQLFYTFFNQWHWSYLAAKFKINLTNRFNFNHPFLPSCVRILASNTFFYMITIVIRSFDNEKGMLLASFMYKWAWVR